MYDLNPEIKIKKFSAAWQGNNDVFIQIKEAIDKNTITEHKSIVIECYPGVDLLELTENLKKYFPNYQLINADDYSLDSEIVTSIIKDTLTEDRVFGIMSHYVIEKFFHEERICEAKEKISKGPTIVYGIGASVLIDRPDLLIYADLARWEIQKRFRKGLSNWKADNENEEQLKKYKRGYFFEWRLADRLKLKLAKKIDYLLDTNIKGNPKLVCGNDYRSGLKQVIAQPFRLVPYFDQSVWGGQWMKEKFNLDPTIPNYGWAFDGVPEENSIYLAFGDVRIEVPAINLVHQYPNELLGEQVRSRFGREFPIRFDYLDTVGGENLSLQVHPMIDYIQDKFGMTYTQNESYYILEASKNSKVYLGLKENVDKNDLIGDLNKASEGKCKFLDSKYVNSFPAKKHDHFLIPSGTVHCSGSDTVVLEISQTPYIFTFKLWDWDRLGLDGKPRPIHIEHGKENIQMEYDTNWVTQNLINRFETLQETKEYKEEKTGLHELEAIETRRHWFTDNIILETHKSVNMLNLIEGETILVESISDSFKPYEIHFGETFIVPEQVKEYRLVNKTNRKVAVLQAFIKELD